MNENSKTKDELLKELMELKREYNFLKAQSEKNISIRNSIEENYRIVTEQSPIAIELYDSQGKLVNVNAACLKLFGIIDSKEISHFSLFADPNISEIHKEKLKNKKSISYQAEFDFDKVKELNLYHTTKSGKVILDIIITPIKDHSDEVSGYLLQIQDITESKNAKDLQEQIRTNYEAFFNTIDDFLFVLDEKGNIIHTNRTVNDRLEYSEEELCGQSVLMIHPIERREEAGRIVGEMLMGKTDFCPVPIITKYGKQIPVETRIKPGVWDGKPVIFGVTKDISQIKLSEEKFSKAFYLNPSPCGLSDIDSGKYIEVNDAFCSLLGYDKKDVIGRTVFELGIFSKETRELILSKAAGDGKVSNFEVELNSKSGGIRNVLISSENIYVQDKKLRYTLVNDFTERKQSAERINELANELQVTLDTVTAGISHICNRKVIWANASHDKMFGYDVGESVGLETSAFYTDTESFNRIGKESSLQFKVEKTYTTEMLMRKKDGTLFWCSLSGQLVNHLNPEEGSIWMLQDISQQKQTEEIINKKNEQLEELNAAKNKFFSIIAHDLKSPFQGFLGLTKIMSEQSASFSPKELSSLGVEMNKMANNLFALLKNLLEWAQNQNGSITYEPNLCNLNEIVKGSHESLDKALKIKCINFKNVVPISLFVNADSKMLTSIFLNLISNAIKFTNRNGEITVTARQENDKMILVSVQDTGIGMEQNLIPKLFKVGEKVGKLGTEGELSTGLGLLLCKDFVSRHGGKIWAESKVEEGTTFYFTIPS